MIYLLAAGILLLAGVCVQLTLRCDDLVRRINIQATRIDSLNEQVQELRAFRKAFQRALTVTTNGTEPSRHRPPLQLVSDTNHEDPQ